MQKVGTATKTALGTLVPLGAAAAGYAIARFAKQSMDMAVEYNAAMTQIAALTDVSNRKVAMLGDTIINLARETAQSPVDLAHSMYFLASAGLTASQQMEALNATAKGAAIGMGSAGDLAKIEANALNVFGDSGLRAADVMDTLAAAVRTGTAEPNEFADALGRVMPIANEAGLSFQQVAATLAEMSNAGLKVTLGVTSLRALLQSLIAPTNQTRDAFAAIGLTADDVVASMQQNGLISTLRTLRELALQNTSSQGDFNIEMRNLIPNIRGLTGAFTLTDLQAKKVDKTFREVADSTGSLDQAFAETAASPAFRLHQAMNTIAIDGMQLAATVLPALATALETVSRNFKPFLDVAARMSLAFVALKLVPPIIGAVIGAFVRLGIAAQLVGAELMAILDTNPVLLLIGGIAIAALVLSKNFKVAVIAIGAMAIAIGSLSGALTVAQARMAAFALAAYAVTEAITSIKGLFSQITQAGTDWSNSLLKQTGSLNEYITRANEANDSTGNWLDQFLGRAAIGDTISKTTQAIHDQNVQILQGTPLMGLYGDNLDIMTTTSAKLHTQLAQLIRDYYVQHNGLEGLNMGVVQGYIAYGSWGKAIGYVQSKLGGITGALRTAAAATYATGATTKNYKDTLDNLATALQTTSADLTDKLQAAATDGKQAMMAFITQTLQGLQKWNDQIATSISGASDVLSTLAGQSKLTASQVHEAFVQAADDARQFGADLTSIAHTGGQTGKDLANALLTLGPSAAGLAHVIAGSGDTMRAQLVSDFGGILKAGRKSADDLQTALVGPLKTIKNVLIALARHWGIDIQSKGANETNHSLQEMQNHLHHITGHTWDVHIARHESDRTPTQHRSVWDAPDTTTKNVNVQVKDDATPVLTSLNNYRFDPKKIGVTAPNDTALSQLKQVQDYPLTDKQINVFIHTTTRSPWPDEALQSRLLDPIKTMGFKQINGTWTLPLDVGVHTGDPSGIGMKMDPGGHTKKGAGLGHLIDIQKDARTYLKQIEMHTHKMLQNGGVGVGGGGSSGTTHGGSGGSGQLGKPVSDAINKIVGTINKFATRKEGFGVVKRVAQAGLNEHFINWSVHQVAQELGKTAARQYRTALELLDQQTVNGKHTDEAIKAARDAMKAIVAHEQHMADVRAAYRQQLIDIAFGGKMPKLPEGHTHLGRQSPGPDGGGHKWQKRVVIDRRRFTQDMVAADTYSGFD